MKTLINLMLGLLISGMGTLMAQTPPPPPPPTPDVSSNVSTSGNYRVTVNSSDSETGENISFSITNTDDEYDVKANFPEETTSELLSYFMEEMGSKNLTKKGSRTQWMASSNGDEVYMISLGKGRLTMHIDKEVASASLVDKFGEMGMAAKTIVTRDDKEDYKDRLQREADRLRRDADRMQREAERLERQAVRDQDRSQRDAQRILDQAERDAARIQREAKRLSREADREGRMLASKGGMDSAVREVLRKANTYYDATNAQNKNGWIWPALQQDLILSLEGDNLVGEDNELVFIRDESGTYVNGNKMSNSTANAYADLLKRHGLGISGYLTFYKLYDHIMVTNSNAEVLEFFNALKDLGEITSVKKPVKIDINGDSVRLDGKLLPENKLKIYNDLLTKHNIIPVPGKVIQLLKKNSYKLGYSIGERTHIGTWGMMD